MNYSFQKMLVISLFILQGLTTIAQQKKQVPISQPLVSHIYTADPSAHVFNGKIYIYPSHDIEAGVTENDNGDHFDMRDYHILSMDSIGGKVTDNGIALDKKNIAWAGRQLWAPDCTYKNGTYYLYFPLKDKMFTSLLLLLFSVIDGIVSPTLICAIAILAIKKNAKSILLILDYFIVSTVFPQVNIIEP